MNELILADPRGRPPSTVSARDLLEIGFRHVRLMVFAFIGLFVAVVLAMLVWPWPYHSEMKILVRKDRVDPVVTSEATERPVLVEGITEQDLNSEVELLRSRDLLEQVVIGLGLHKQPDSWLRRLKDRVSGVPSGPEAEPLRIARATLNVEQRLTVEPIQKTSLIRVSFESGDPELSARVVRTLGEKYLDKHLAVRRPAGVADFFEQETVRSREQLDAAKAKMEEFSRSSGVVSATAERDAALLQATDLEHRLSETRAELAAVEQRVSVLQAERARTPERTSTESREASARLQELQRSKLLELELKRVELMRVYQSTYPLVVEVEQQIATTREAIALAERAPIQERATDVNPTYEWINTELEKARSEQGALQARVASLQSALTTTRGKAQTLDRLALESRDLERDLKTAEDNYVSYRQKQEEARISNALDTRRIVNVAVAEPAAVPLRSTRPGSMLIMVLAGLVATAGSLGLVFVFDTLDPSLRTPNEVYAVLDAPVFASFADDRSLPASYRPVPRRITDGKQR